MDVLPGLLALSRWLDEKGQAVKGNLRDPAGLLANFAQEVQQGAAKDKSAWDATRSVMPEVRAQGVQEINQRGQELGGLLGVIKPSVARALNTVPQLPSNPVFREAVTNTPGAQMAEDGLLMRVARSQDPAQGQTPSVRGGVFYLPEGAAQMKHYSTGKNGYGGTEKVSGETLLQAPLFAKGGTGGKAPESAYDQLLGKGSYQGMRTDALNTTRYGKRSYGAPSNVDESATAMEVEKFLQKYAPELVDNADHIVQNSKKGNQLAYALQEAAVGSAVRKAGYDSVLGYSKGKAGNFLSELFDVRESHYPDKFGFSKVHDSFKPAATARELTPFERAHAEAQRNAALPVEQGGLGLGQNNTAAERAKAMGFSQPGYHGTGKDFEAFADDAWTSASPMLANRYAKYKGPDDGGSPTVMPLLVKKGKTLKIGGDANWKVTWPEARQMTGLEFKSASPYADEAVDGILQKDLLWRIINDEGFKSAARGAGKDSVAIGEQGLRTTLSLDPKNVRSRFAAFDPKKRDSRDLLASLGLMGLLGAGAYGSEQQ